MKEKKYLKVKGYFPLFAFCNLSLIIRNKMYVFIDKFVIIRIEFQIFSFLKIFSIQDSLSIHVRQFLIPPKDLILRINLSFHYRHNFNPSGKTIQGSVA